jgi:hypothetical protein
MRRKRLLRDPLVECFEDPLSRRPRWPLLDALALPSEIVDGTFGRDPLHDPRVARSRSSCNVWCQMRWRGVVLLAFRICQANALVRPRAAATPVEGRAPLDALDFVGTVREGDFVAATPERPLRLVRHRR